MNDTSLSGAYRVFEDLHGESIHSNNQNRPFFTAQQLQAWLDENSPGWEVKYRLADASAFRELIEKARMGSLEARADQSSRPICSNCHRALSPETVDAVKSYLESREMEPVEEAPPAAVKA